MLIEPENPMRVMCPYSENHMDIEGLLKVKRCFLWVSTRKEHTDHLLESRLLDAGLIYFLKPTDDTHPQTIFDFWCYGYAQDGGWHYVCDKTFSAVQVGNNVSIGAWIEAKPAGAMLIVERAAALLMPKPMKFIQEVTRIEDMSAKGFLKVMRDGDGDVIVAVCGMRDGMVQPCEAVEFCVGRGGNRSPRTVKKLIELAEAMELDNLENPIVV